LDQSELLNEQVHADELQELLARLAATDALFSEAVPTIRDVAEATDASPLLIGRILSQMRGPDEVAELKGRMDGFEARLRDLERDKRSTVSSLRSRSFEPSEEFKSIDFNKLLGDAGVGEFQPELGWLAQKRLMGYDQSLSSDPQNIGWHGNEPSHRIARVVVTLFVGMLLAMVIISNNPGCQQNPPEAERPIPFPIERSTR
jgi:chaperonin cofactor prefoldin